MTVSELIYELEQFDDEQKICIRDSGGYLNNIGTVKEMGLYSFYGKNKNGIVTLFLGGQLGMGIDEVEEEDALSNEKY